MSGGFVSSITKGLCLGAALTLAGCGWMGGVFVDRSEDYLEAESEPQLQLPPDMSEEALVDALAVPELPPRPQERYFAEAPPRPSGLFGPEEGEHVRIQMLGEQRWLIIPQAPSLVWPKLKQFFLDNGVPISHESPADGELVTEWMDLYAGQPRDLVRRALAEAKAQADIEGGRDRLRVRLEQGLRENTSEVIIRHENDLLARSTEEEAAPVGQQASVTDVEFQLLNELGAYVAADVGQRSFSFQAAGIAREGKARVIDDEEGQPALRLQLDFDRAWATVRRALDEADIEVEDMDRSERVFYLRMSDSDFTGADERGMFSRWFGSAERYGVELQLREDEDGFLCTMHRGDGKPLERDKGQNLLVKLRELGG